MTKRTQTIPAHRATLIAAAAMSAAAALLPTTTARAGQTGDAVTISLSGSTAMRNFTVSNNFTLLNPGTTANPTNTITLNSGPGGTPVTYSAGGRPGKRQSTIAGITVALIVALTLRASLRNQTCGPVSWRLTWSE
jgi:ABC-type phosphate transport system substrate-binding protein